MYWRRSVSRTISVTCAACRDRKTAACPRRVAAADDGHRIAAAHQRLRLGGRVVDAHLLEVVRPRDGQPPVPRPGRDDHRRGRDSAPSASRTWTGCVPADGRGLGGHGEVGAELPGLDQRPLGQFGAGDAGREAEVVLDPGRRPPGPRWLSRPAPPCAGLPRPRTRRRTGRPGADHQQVTAAVRGDRHGQPDGRGQLGVGRVAQQPVADDHDRGLLGRHTELAEQRLGRRIGLQIQPAVGQPVAGREVAQPPGVRRVPGTDDAEASAQADQDRAAEEVGAQHQLTEPGIADDQVPELVHRHHEHLARPGGTAER